MTPAHFGNGLSDNQKGVGRTSGTVHLLRTIVSFCLSNALTRVTEICAVRIKSKARLETGPASVAS